MGEPLNNYGALMEAIQIITGYPFQLSPKRITISTVGTPYRHALKLLAEENYLYNSTFLSCDMLLVLLLSRLLVARFSYWTLSVLFSSRCMKSILLRLQASPAYELLTDQLSTCNIYK